MLSSRTGSSAAEIEQLAVELPIRSVVKTSATISRTGSRLFDTAGRVHELKGSMTPSGNGTVPVCLRKIWAFRRTTGTPSANKTGMRKHYPTDEKLMNCHHQRITERTHHKTLLLVGITFFTQWSKLDAPVTLVGLPSSSTIVDGEFGEFLSLKQGRSTTNRIPH